MKTNARAAIFAVSKSMAQAFLIVLVMAVPLVASEAVPVAEKHKSVLLLFSEDSSLPTQAIIEQSLRSTLRNGSPVPLEVYSEYLGFRRTPVDGYEKELVSLLRRKYEGRKFDLIIAVQPTALGVLLKNRPEIFPDTPVVFQVLDQRDVAGLNLGPNVTGVWGEINFKPNLDLALTLHPNTRKVVLLGGVSEFDKYWMARVQQDFLAYEGKLEFTYLIGLTIAEQQQALSSLAPHTIVVFVSTTRDNAGNNHYNPDFLRQISSASSAPIYGTTDAQLGSGIVGGSIVSFEAFGVQTARLGLRILAGEKTQAIAPHGVPNVVMFDWRQLRRWSIDEIKLPPGSIIRFKEFSFWELYKWRIIVAVSIIILQALGIGWLLFTRAKRRQAEEAKDKLAAIVETSDDAILSKTLEGTIISWNAGAEKIYGYSANEIVGQHVSTLAPPELKGEVEGILERLSRGEGVDHLETQRVSKEGMRIDVSLTISPIKNERGIIIGASTIARDITVRKKAEVEELQHREELAHLSRVTMLGELSGSLAHELNQPLTAILSNAQAAQHFLEHDSVDLDELRDILTDIVDQDIRAGEVIHRLRLLLKKGEVDQQPLDVNNTVQEVLKLIDGDLVNHGVTMHTKLAPALPPVKGDRVQLQQVLLNLVMNASDAMSSHSSTERQMVVCTEFSDGEGVRFSVSDCGSGIAPDELEQVFEPFFTTKPHGLGLGLSVCRTIISAHGGKLWAANNPERGATFHFTVPVSNEANR
jgi:PAS domain S-box-containing protein